MSKKPQRISLREVDNGWIVNHTPAEPEFRAALGDEEVVFHNPGDVAVFIEKRLTARYDDKMRGRDD